MQNVEGRMQNFCLNSQSSIKILGQRRSRGTWPEADRLMRTVISLRKTRPFMPKGVYRFRSFEEAHKWAIRMMAREERQNEECRMKNEKLNRGNFAAGSDESRPPTVNDLVGLCRRLNEAGAKYIVIGGMAVVQHGFVRATEDIDLLVDVSPVNQKRIRSALMGLPDGAVREMKPDDLNAYMVVRVADEIVVDLMKSANGIEYAEAGSNVEWVEVQGVRIPFANLDLLWRLKQTVREKDALDRTFLKEKLKKDAKW